MQIASRNVARLAISPFTTFTTLNILLHYQLLVTCLQLRLHFALTFTSWLTSCNFEQAQAQAVFLAFFSSLARPTRQLRRVRLLRERERRAKNGEVENEERRE